MLTLLDELDHKITNFESKIENKENEKKEKKKKIKEALAKYQTNNSIQKSMKLPKYNLQMQMMQIILDIKYILNKGQLITK